jgi:hypothetical protein
MSDRRNAWGFSLFCDDIRVEVGGKLSVMGIYQSDMIFPADVSFPLTVPKFCILIKYFELLDAFSDDLEFRVFLPGDPADIPSTSTLISRSALPKPEHPKNFEPDQEKIFTATVPIVFGPFPIKQEGFLKVRVQCGGVTTNLGSLMIRNQRPDEQMAFG